MARKKTPAAPAPAHTMAELELMEKYPLLNVVPGSLLGADNAVFPGKKVVTYTCPRCQAPRTIPTSDAWHCLFCAACTREHARQRLRERRREQKVSDAAEAARAAKPARKGKAGRRAARKAVA